MLHAVDDHTWRKRTAVLAAALVIGGAFALIAIAQDAAEINLVATQTWRTPSRNGKQNASCEQQHSSVRLVSAAEADVSPSGKKPRSSPKSKKPAGDSDTTAQETPPTPAPAADVPALLPDAEATPQADVLLGVPTLEPAAPAIVPYGDAYAPLPSSGWPGFAPGLTVVSPPDLFWGEIEYLLWWTEGFRVPALVTSSPPGTVPGDAGVLGASGTSILLGNRTLDTDPHSGLRMTVGCGLPAYPRLGVQGSYFWLAKQTAEFTAASPATPIIARPFFDEPSASQASLLVAHPDFLTGSLLVNASTELQSAEILLRGNFWGNLANRTDALLGYRFGLLSESLRVSSSSQWTVAQGPILAGTTKDILDAFDTDNQFHGIDIGLVHQLFVGRWSFEFLAKLALGNNRGKVTIDGSTVTAVPGGGSASFVGGLLAQETNIGKYTDDAFALIPEFAVAIRYNLTDSLRLMVGYTFLYWSNMLRPGDQIDLQLSQLPPEPPAGQHGPAVLLVTDDFWAQGINLGLEYRF